MLLRRRQPNFRTIVRASVHYRRAPVAGATYLGEGRCRFRVWAPSAQHVKVHLFSPQDRLEPLRQLSDGYHEGILAGVFPGSLYRYRLGGGLERPDPASRSQPQGVHGPSEVIDPAFSWGDGGWPGVLLEDYILYELHVGTFTPSGTFDAVISRLEVLRTLGITAIELMPIAQFPGDRNWGYDGVYPFAVQHSYGGGGGLRRLVDACHRLGMAVVLDVVYNHLGPEGNYLRNFGPYFTDRYRTPWGEAVNFDGPDSGEVRGYFIDNALYWISELHIDALRLDAVHAIFDFSAVTFLEELRAAVHAERERLHRHIYLIAESDLNDARITRAPELGGYGIDAQWSDDFHHSLHSLLTGERLGYYEDFGQLGDLATALREGFVYSGRYSKYRKRRFGNTSRELPASRLVVCNQNHDQVGNRMMGERLTRLVSFEAQKLAAGMLLLSPFIPMLFMGEEYGEPAPFLYFVSHTDPGLVEAVRAGRRSEFTGFAWLGEVPDPQDPMTFQQSKIEFTLQEHGRHRVLFELHRELLRLRRELPVLAIPDKVRLEVLSCEKQRTLYWRRWWADRQVFAVFNFSQVPGEPVLPVPEGRWRRELDSSAARWTCPASEGEAVGQAGSRDRERSRVSAGTWPLAAGAIPSDGELRVSIGPLTFALFIKEQES